MFSAGRNSLTVNGARGVFVLFAALIGLSMSTLFVVYTQGSIFSAFFETAAAFACLSLYGYSTKRDLSPIGSFLIMGLFGVIIVSIVNLFMHSAGLQWGLSLLTLGIFAGLTAWDTQNLKASYYAGAGYEVDREAGDLRRAVAVPELHQHVPEPAVPVRPAPQLISLNGRNHEPGSATSRVFCCRRPSRPPSRCLRKAGALGSPRRTGAKNEEL